MTVARNFIVAYRDDPLKFIQNCLKVEPDPWQKDFLEHLQHRGSLTGSTASSPCAQVTAAASLL